MLPILYTIGHSNRSYEELVALLEAHEVQAVADVRRSPGSRSQPQFQAHSLAVALPESGIEYLPCKILGGRRTPLQDSPNSGWTNPGFRGYADYMATPEFEAGLKFLLEFAAHKPYAIMCAEAVPWRCHRNLVADAAVRLHGWEVRHIMSATKYNAHEAIPFGRIIDQKLVYPADDMLAPLAGLTGPLQRP